MSTYRITPTPDNEGWRFVLLCKRGILFAKEKSIPLSDWSAAAPSSPGATLLLTLVAAEEALPDGEAVRLTHNRVARLTSAESRWLGLPTINPFTLFLSREAPISDPGFRLRLEWFERGGGPVLVTRRKGTLLETGGKLYLLLDPIFSLLRAIDDLNASGGAETDEAMDRRLVAYAAFKERLAQVTGDVRADDYLQGLSLHHATGLGIDLEPGEGQPFVPTLYGDRSLDAVTAENEDREPEREPLLPQYHAKRFRDRFASQGSRRHYTLESGVYTVLDAPVTAALAVVQRINRADAPTRQAFQKDPLAFFLPAIEAVGGDGAVLCDLRGYGERVIGIGPWEQAKLSFRLPVSREWFPAEDTEVFTIEIPGEAPLLIRRNEVEPLKDSLVKAEQFGMDSIQIGGRTLARTPELEKTIQGLVGYTHPEPSQEPPPPEPAAPKEHKPKFAARTKNNEEELIYRAQKKQKERNPQGLVKPAELQGLRSQSKPHQDEAIRWLQTAYLRGAPGLLLADDMGLGKTFQVLAFLRWLRDKPVSKARQPVLIVAPKTLLDTWREELAQHLGADALGKELYLSGDRLRQIKIHSGAGKDTDQERATLDVEHIESTDLVLTTYETLRDYHLSFGKVRFSVIVYDEAQKLKNPLSLMNTGAKAQQGDFILMVTGTPIENSVIDLWTLLDIAWPGFLDLSAREFLNRYGIDDPDCREELKRRLVESTSMPDGGYSIPAIMLRRFKQDILEGLPERKVELIRKTMPQAQQQAYDAVLAQIKNKELAAIAALQALRAISLHPHLAMRPKEPNQHQTFIEASARFSALFRILDRLHAGANKALIFVEIRDAQAILQDLIQNRYQLRAQIINGETAAPARKRIREDFQQSRGFNVLILGPKAAGFGLTLTAANHVIHLNRWWNPAVEDQCSDRVYRIGQDKPVTIHLPMAIHPALGDRSFDVVLHDLMKEKRALSRDIVIPVQFDEGDFQRLLEGAVGVPESVDPELLARIDNMDWITFEHWVADKLNQAGYEVKMTPNGADGGADVIATPQGATGPVLIVQCKHRSQVARANINDTVVGELLAAKSGYAPRTPTKLLAVTNAAFTLAAQMAAEEKGVMLVDRSQLDGFPQATLGMVKGPDALSPRSGSSKQADSLML